MKPTTLLLTLCIPVALTGACGGDDDATSTTAATTGTAGGGTAGGGNTGNEGGEGGAGVGGSGGDATGGMGGGGPPDCMALGLDVRMKLIAAQGCDPQAPQNECTQVVEGICCPDVVSAGKMAEIAAYEMSLAAFNDAMCMVDCPTDPPCNPMPVGVCQPAAVGGQCAIMP